MNPKLLNCASARFAQLLLATTNKQQKSSPWNHGIAATEDILPLGTKIFFIHGIF